MMKVQKAGEWISKWFTLLIVIWTFANYFAPSLSLWLAHGTTYLLGIVLFGMGLTLNKNDFKGILRRPVPVLLGTAAHYLIMPFVAWVLCQIFGLTGAVAFGVILVGSCPSGTSSSVMAFLAKGDVALDVSIEALSTLLAPVMLPLMLQIYAGKYVSVPAASLFQSTLEIVVAPIILGVLVNTFFGKNIKPVKVALPLISQIAILLIIGVVFAVNHANLFNHQTLLVIPVVMIHNLTGYGLGYLFAHLIRLKQPQRKAITFEVGMQDSSLGATLAIKYFAPMAAIPSTIFSIWHNISGSVLSSLWRQHTEKQEAQANATEVDNDQATAKS